MTGNVETLTEVAYFPQMQVQTGGIPIIVEDEEQVASSVDFEALRMDEDWAYDVVDYVIVFAETDTTSIVETGFSRVNTSGERYRSSKGVNTFVRTGLGADWFQVVLNLDVGPYVPPGGNPP